MDLFLCWLLGPLILILVALGLSFGLELITGARFSWLVRPGLGLALMIVVAQFAVSTDATAELAIPLIVALGILGLFMGWSAGLIAGPVPRWEIAGALGVYFVFAAPVIFSGEPTWAGYVKLDDTATWMGLTDHAFEFGRRTTGFPASTWEALIAVNAGNGYPIGSFVPMALIGKVVGQDVAWTVQPSMALHGLRICMGPLIQFDRGSLPDWLYLWEGEYDDISDSVLKFAEGVVRRYAGKVHLWNCAGRMNVPGAMDLSEEQRLKLTVDMLESLAASTPALPPSSASTSLGPNTSRLRTRS